MILDEVKALISNYDVSYFSFTDDDHKTRTFGAKTDIENVIDNLREFGHCRRQVFNVWCVGWVIHVTMDTKDDIKCDVFPY